VNQKPVEVKVAPIEGDLQSVMKVDNVAIAAHEQATPNRRIDTAQQSVELIDLKGFPLTGHDRLSEAAHNRVYQHPVFPALHKPGNGNRNLTAAPHGK
jgi:hypothetical protein